MTGRGLEVNLDPPHASAAQVNAHADAAGALCEDRGDGCCWLCGVALVGCEECSGLGYHVVGCIESDEVRAAIAERLAWAVRL